MPQVYGNTSGLSPSAHKSLERIYRRKVPLAHSMNLRLAALFARFAFALIAFLIGYRSWRSSLSD